jgi:hypothetical protein
VPHEEDTREPTNPCSWSRTSLFFEESVRVPMLPATAFPPPGALHPGHVGVKGEGSQHGPCTRYVLWPVLHGHGCFGVALVHSISVAGLVGLLHAPHPFPACDLTVGSELLRCGQAVGAGHTPCAAVCCACNVQPSWRPSLRCSVVYTGAYVA